MILRSSISLPPSHQMADLEQQWQNPGWQGFSAVKLVLLPLNAAEPNVGKGQITARHPGSYYYARREQFFFFLIKKCPEGPPGDAESREQSWHETQWPRTAGHTAGQYAPSRTRTALFSFSSLFFTQSKYPTMDGEGRTTGIIKLSWIQTLYLQPWEKYPGKKEAKWNKMGWKVERDGWRKMSLKGCGDGRLYSLLYKCYWNIYLYSEIRGRS